MATGVITPPGHVVHTGSTVVVVWIQVNVSTTKKEIFFYVRGISLVKRIRKLMRLTGSVVGGSGSGRSVGGLNIVASVQSAVNTPAEAPKNVTIFVAGHVKAIVQAV